MLTQGPSPRRRCKLLGTTVSTFLPGSTVTRVLVDDGHVTGVETDKTAYAAPAVVNCAGAWSGQVGPVQFPTRPVKGQMLALVGEPELLRHVIRTRECYLVPRSDGRVVIGSTLEEAGFDKRTDADTIHRLHLAALNVVPKLARARILERVGPDCAPARPTVYLCWEKLQLRDTLRPPGTFVTVFS